MRILPFLPVVLALGCQSKITVVVTNAKPVATILAPTTGESAVEGSTYTLRGTASDPTTDPPELVARWFVDGAEVCAGSVPAEDGTTTCDMTVPGAAASVRLEVVDPDGASDEATATLEVEANTAPTALITAPLATAVLYSDRLITLDGTGSDAETSAASLSASWTSSRDGALSTPAPDSEGRVLGAVNLTEGEHFLTFTVTDENGKSATDSVTVDVGPPNTAPSCGITAPADGAEIELGASLTLRGMVSDVNVPADLLTVTWASDKDGVLGTSTPTTSGDVVFTAQALSAATHTLTLTAMDEVGGRCTDLVQVVVGTAPTLTWTQPAAGAVVRLGELVTVAATVSDAESPATSLSLTWTSSLDGLFSSQGADSSGLVDFTTSSLRAGTHTLTARVTDPDGLFVERTRVVRVNTPPTTPGVAVSPSPARTEDALVASLSTASVDADGDAVSVAWSWYKDGVATAFTGPSVPASATAKGETWTARATPSDGTHDGVAGEATVVIANTAPNVTTVSVTPSSAPVGTSVTCAATASDPDETAAVTYAWTVNGASVATGATYTVGSAGEGRGASLVCTATARDGDGATDVGTASVTVSNTPPTLASVSLAPLDPVAGDSVVCTASGASDADGDAVTVAYAWTRNGRAAGTGDTYAGDLQSGDVLSCTATPNDGVANGTALSASVSVGNTAPELFGPVVTPSSAPVGTVLTCAASASDVDGSNPVVTYRWTNAGVPIGTDATYTVAASDDPGDALTCTATADDGEGGTTAAAASATVQNTAPVVASVVLTPSGPRTNDVVTATASGSDINGQTLTWTYAFAVNGTVVQSGSATTLSGALYFGRDDVLTVTALASDGAATGQATSAPVTVLNTAPTAPVIAIAPESPVEGDALTCSVVTASSDADGDALTYTYGWRVDGADAGLSGATLAADETAAGEVWSCVATVSDGSAGNSSIASVVVDAGCDLDGDGYRSETCGGDDCNDLNSWIFLRAGDLFGDGVDGDCDGMDCEAGLVDDVYVAACAESMTWSGAGSRCVSAGYDGLFEPSTAARDNGFQQLVSRAPGLDYINHWIGLSRGSSSWQWISGSVVSFTNWSPTEPNGDGTCAHYFGQGDPVRGSRWNDLPCNSITDRPPFGVFTLSPACMAL
jgi:hypothetical protein